MIRRFKPWLIFTTLVASFVCIRPCSAVPLNLSLLQVTNISGLNANGLGGMDFDNSSGRLWLSDAGSGTNTVFSINPFTGAIFSSFNASVIPDLDSGPDALAIQPGTGNLYLFSTFLESEAGVVSQSGALVTDFGSTVYDAGGAAFSPGGTLYLVSQNSGALSTVNATTGAILSTTALTGFSGRLAAADFDPVSGNLFAYASLTQSLLEIDVNTATVLSTTNISSFLSSPSFPSGLAFNATGDTLFFVSGTELAADELVVLRRSGTSTVIPEPSTMAIWSLLGAIGFLGTARRR